AMSREVENVVLVTVSEIEIAAMDDELILEAVAHGHDLARRRDDRALADHIVTLLQPALRRCHDPGAVLVGPGLHHQVIVEQLQRIEIEAVAEPDGRVVAQQDHLYSLQAHHPIGFRPAPVVANTHSEDATEGAPDLESQIADLEEVFFQMLALPAGKGFGTARQMDLAVLAYDPALLVDQNRRVEPSTPTLLHHNLGIAEMKADSESLSLLE